MRALTPRIVACWADPVLVGPHAELEVRAYVACAGVKGAAATVTLVLRDHDSGAEHRVPGTPLADPGSRPRPLPGKPVVLGTHVVTRLDGAGLGLGEGRWGALVEVASAGRTWERRLPAERVDPMVDPAGSLRPPGHARYPVRLTPRGNLLVDVHADPVHVEVGEVWVHGDRVDVHGRLAADDGVAVPATPPGSTRGVAVRRSDGHERHLRAEVGEDGQVTVRVAPEDLLPHDGGPDDHTWDLVVETADRRLRLAGLLDDITHKATVHSYPALQTGTGSVEVRFDARNLLVVRTGHLS